jgi:hypothetical protein
VQRLGKKQTEVKPGPSDDARNPINLFICEKYSVICFTRV